MEIENQFYFILCIRFCILLYKLNSDLEYIPSFNYVLSILLSIYEGVI